ncbi:MAG: hypothetical protein KDD84_06150 [Caldilineaceae bacterium]|nr:hypothetical protein [Caldilineaceae bacterium]
MGHWRAQVPARAGRAFDRPLADAAQTVGEDSQKGEAVSLLAEVEGLLLLKIVGLT